MNKNCIPREFDEKYKHSILRDISLMHFKNSSSVQPLQNRRSYYHFSLLHYPQCASDTPFPLSAFALTKTARWYRSSFAVLRLSLRNSVEHALPYVTHARYAKKLWTRMNYFWFRDHNLAIEHDGATGSII